MQYATVRNHIKTGDILAVHGTSLLAVLTRVVQKLGGLGHLAAVTHVGVAWWVEGRLYSVEMDGRHNVLRSLSQHITEGCGVDVYRCPVTVSEAMPAQFDRATSYPIKYSVPDLIKIGLRLIFGGNTEDNDDREMVCSTFASRWLQWSGWHPPCGFPDMPSPAELCQSLGAPIFAIEAATERP